MEEAGVTHGATVRADIIGAHTSKPVVYREEGQPVTASVGPTKVFFCQMPEGNGFRVRETLQKGDGGPVTDKVCYDDSIRRVILGLEPWSDVNIVNAIVANNGTTRIMADAATRIVVTGKRGKRVHEVLAVV
ncbi:MAG: hypothetical protein HUU49_05070 [Candidatus Buchananbacteria bacterium]|nr:hypothetical protein [Candidatus Buchananbacteria bacterium]